MGNRKGFAAEAVQKIAGNRLARGKAYGVYKTVKLGKGGGEAVILADYPIVINSSETARIQEIHLLIGHTFCEFAEMEMGFEQ